MSIYYWGNAIWFSACCVTDSCVFCHLSDAPIDGLSDKVPCIVSFKYWNVKAESWNVDEQ